MTLESEITKLTAQAADYLNDVKQLQNTVDDKVATIEGYQKTFMDNNQAMNDWQTRASGNVTFKGYNGTTQSVPSMRTLMDKVQTAEVHPKAMTKAQFNALQETNRNTYAGSGFIEWGRHHTSLPTYENVNEGMWCSNGFNEHLANRLVLGRGPNLIHGINSQSDSITPVVNVDGAIIHLYHVGHDKLLDPNMIRFPPAPDGTKTFDIKTGEVVQHDSAEQAFGELKFIEPKYQTGGAYEITKGEFNIESNDISGFGLLTEVGEKRITVCLESPIDLEVQLKDSASIDGSARTITSHTLKADQPYTLEVEDTLEDAGIYVRFPKGQAGTTVKIHSLRVRPASEQVITERQDIAFLEVWHEKITDRDVVYPLGNVQFYASSYAGINLSVNLAPQGYTAFGAWDKSTNSRGARWSTLTDAEKTAFLSDHKNNIYYDPDEKAYIQVRYRVRVVEGRCSKHGAVVPNTTVGWGLGKIDGAELNEVQITPQGKEDTLADDFSSWRTHGNYLSYRHHSQRRKMPEKGLYIAADKGNSSNESSKGYEGHCYAVPIARVQRLNQGAYHPTYNPMGTGKRRISSGYYYFWNETHGDLSEIHSVVDCFDKGANHGGGNIGQEEGFACVRLGETHSGRFDKYQFHDAIYAGQVEDLRLNANKLAADTVREESIRKAVRGELRGKSKVLFTKMRKHTVSQSAAYDNGVFMRLKDVPNLLDVFRSKRYGAIYNETTKEVFYVSSTEKTALYINRNPIVRHLPDSYVYGGREIEPVSTSFVTEGDTVWLIDTQELDTEFESLPSVDIIGYPDKIAATFPDGVIGQWIDKLPDNSNGYQLNKKMGSQGLFGSYTLNTGLTWNNQKLLFDPIKNTNTGSWNPDAVALLHYDGSTEFTTSGESLPAKSIGRVFAGSNYLNENGGRLIQSLINNHAKSGTGNGEAQTLSLNSYSLDYAPGFKGAFMHTGYNPERDYPKHQPLSLIPPKNEGRGVKALDTLIEKDGLLYLQLHGVELTYQEPEVVTINSQNLTTNMVAGKVYKVEAGAGSTHMDGKLWYCKVGSIVDWNNAYWLSHFDGSIGVDSKTDKNIYLDPYEPASWGDDHTIPTTGYENHKTDRNGHVVKVCCHHSLYPVGIA